MTKKLIVSSLIIVLVPTVLFIIVYAWLSAVISNYSVDYSKDVIGEWTAIQYYVGKEKYVCDEEHPVTVSITENTITVSGEGVPMLDGNYTWRTGEVIETTYQEEVVLIKVSFDSNNHLKLKFDDPDLSMLLTVQE